MADETLYRFGPLQSNGFVLGLRVPQLVGFAAAAALAIVFLTAGGLLGFFLAIATLAVASLLLLVPVLGHTADEWAPIGVRFLLGGWTKRSRFRSQLGTVGHLVTLPSGDLEPQRVGDPKSLPAELAGLEYLEAGLERYEGARMGVVVDRKARTFTAVITCQGQAFALSGAEEQERRLQEYGGVLAALARDDTPLRRVAWTERTLPGDGDEMASYLVDHMRDDLTLDAPSGELVSYFQLLSRSSDVADEHELMFSVQIDTFRPSARRAIKRMGGGDLAALAVLAGEVGQVADLLDDAGIAVTGVLTRRGLAACIRDAYDPWGRRDRARKIVDVEDGLNDAAAGPLARDEYWGHIATDGALHTTMWVAEWPRIDVRALFLQPLLMQTQTTRTITMVMELVGPGRSIRKVEHAATEAATEQAIRARIGQRTSQRQKAREEATFAREAELSKGHAEVRFAAYVTVSTRAGASANAADELEAAVSRVELEAKRAPLRLERLWGQQAEAFTMGALPLARGLR